MIFLLIFSASVCRKPLPLPPIGGKIVLARSGISYGPCYYTYKDGSVPSCPNIKVERKNSLWQSPKKKDETAKVVYRYGISITGTTNNFIIDEAIMNVSFSAPSEFDSFKENKASILNFNIYIVVLATRLIRLE